MEIRKVQKENSLKIFLVGTLDAVSSPNLQEELDNSITQTITDLVFDFANLEYISSAGLRVILNAQKVITANKGNMKIINVKQDVMDVFEITGFNEILTIEKK